MNCLTRIRVRRFRSVGDASLEPGSLCALVGEADAGKSNLLGAVHSPAFLNVARLDELVLVERDPGGTTTVLQPSPLPAGDDFRALSEFDAKRSELFLARAAILVEGRTEKLVFPFVFEALGHDADGETISIVECGGKGNLPLFIDICKAVRVPYVVVHDRDAASGSEPIAAEAALNELILAAAGADRVVALEPDIERVAGIRGRSHKPERAWRRFADSPGDVPEPLERAVRLALALARN